MKNATRTMAVCANLFMFLGMFGKIYTKIYFFKNHVDVNICVSKPSQLRRHSKKKRRERQLEMLARLLLEINFEIFIILCT